MMFGAKNEEEFISYKPWEISPDHQRDGRASAEKSKEMIETAIREGSHFFEWTHQRIGGEEFPADVLLTRIEQNGKVIIQATVRNITERKRAEEALRESERVLKEAQSLGRLGNWSYNLETQTITWSEQVYQLFERDPILGPPTLEEEAAYYSPEQAQILHDYSKRAIEEGQSFEYDLKVNLPAGNLLSLSAKMQPVKDAKGRVVKLFGTIQDVTERKHREEEIRSRNEELTTLYQLSRLLADANDLENVIVLVTRHAVENVHTIFASIALLKDGELVPQAVFPIRNLEHDFIIGNRQPINTLPFCQHVLEKNEPVMLRADSPEIGSAERSILLVDFAQSVLLVPLRVSDPTQRLDQALVLLILGEARQEKREQSTPEKIRLARSIGDQAAAAIRRLLLSEQAGHRLQQLASLSEIDRTIASNFDLRVSLQMILKHVSEQLEVDAADVLVFNDRLHTLEYVVGRGFRSTASEPMRLRLGQGQAGQAALERRIIKIPDVASSGAIFAQPEFIQAEQVEAYFAVPLINKGQIMGVLEVYQRTPLDPNEEWFDFLRTLAGQAAIAIDNVHLFDSLQRSNDELELAYDATIEGWSRALDLRDKETEGHTLRVTEMTVSLGRSLSLGEEELMQVRRGALLHDIGKMGVPDGILLKPGPLTDEEWLVMKKHPILAYQMLSPIRYLNAALDIPYCHHEWWDGTGYPRGLKGELIPLAARIFSVVDVWDALISDRPYRKAWSKEKTLEHIQAEAGTHFDPQVVKTFFQEFGKKDTINSEIRDA